MGVVTSGLAYWAPVRVIRHVPPLAAMTRASLSAVAW